MLRSDVPRETIAGATSLVIHCAMASAIGQRSVAGGENTTRCLSGRSSASTVTTSVAVHSPGPVIGCNGLKTASSASCNWHDEGAISLCADDDRSPATISGRSCGSGIVSAAAIELSRKMLT